MSAVPVVLVTGASRGLGRGIAIEAASEGFSVAIGYATNTAAAEETAVLCRRAARGATQTFAQIEERLDEISRAIVGATVAAQKQADPEPFERIEARISALARQSAS